MNKEVKRFYKDYERINIGCSDYDALCLAGPDVNGDLTAEILSYAGDGTYYAYLVDSEAETDDYKLLYTFTYWLKIYDDYGLVNEFKASCIKIYRGGDFGTIIQLFGERKP